MAKARSEWSGQVLIETVASIGHRDASDQRWTAKSIGSANGFTRFRSQGKGAGSLLDIATRSCLENSAFLTPETLENVPWHVGRRLWDIIKKNQLDSVQVWQAFAATYPDAPRAQGLYHRLKYIRKPQAPLLDYITPLRCEELSWLTILTLQDMVVTRGQMVQGIASLVNVEVLSLGPELNMMLNENDGEYTAGVDDAVIEAWIQHALVPYDNPIRPFRALKVLNLAEQPDVTDLCRTRCPLFPALQLINFIDCKSVGFERTDDEEDRTMVEIAYTGWAMWHEKNPRSTVFTGWDNFALACLRFIGEYSTNTKKGFDGVNNASPPRLHLLLGEDRMCHWKIQKGLEMLSYKRNKPPFEHKHSDYDQSRAKKGKFAAMPAKDASSGESNHRQKTKVIDMKDTLTQFLS